ncbi:MAG: zinc metallopeptidase [Bacilli bacterium]|nr:zinc metallopeptidase [Bacilli bacterium]
MEMIILGITLIITLGAQAYINSAYNQTRRIKAVKGLSGADVARKILNANGLKSVKVEEQPGTLTDHYDPRSKVVRLSTDIYNNTSLASVSVASHECGHAIQDKDGYFFLRLRSSIVPLVNIASTLGYVAIMIGLVMGAIGFIRIGIIMELVILAFQLITLPVEFNASSRALKQITELGIVSADEHKYCRKMLTAAALTYVAAVATAALQVLRLVLIARDRN